MRASEPIANHVDVGSDQFAQVGDVVDEADPRSQHAVGRVFGHFCGRDVHEDHTEVVQQERPVEPGHQFAGPFAVDSYDHAVGTHEIFDGISLFQKFRIGSHVERDFDSARRQFPFDRFPDLRGGAYRYRAFGDQQRILRNARPERFRDVEHMAQIRPPVFVRRRADRDEDDVDAVDDRAQIGSERQASRPHVFLDQRVQFRFVDRNLSVLQAFDLLRIRIYAGDFDSHFREAGARYQSDVPAADNRNSH